MASFLHELQTVQSTGTPMRLTRSSTRLARTNKKDNLEATIDIDEDDLDFESLNGNAKDEDVHELQTVQSTGTPMRLTRSSTRLARTNKKDNVEVVLVYPFECNVDQSYRDADGLHELGGLLCNSPTSMRNETMTMQRKLSNLITITKDDVRRLEPARLLNDTLIDFFMRW